MSMSEMRAALADAISAVDDITGFRERPNAAKGGDAWAMWRGATAGPAGAFLQRWSVVILLPQQNATAADEFLEAHAYDLVDALASLLYIEEIVPADLGRGDATEFALMITGRSER